MSEKIESMVTITVAEYVEERVAEAICDADFWPGMWATLDKDSDEAASYRRQARAACLAMLKAWPGAYSNGPQKQWRYYTPAIILPLKRQEHD